MDLKIGVLIGLVVGAILIAALLPTALDALYDQSDGAKFKWDNGLATGGTNDTATLAIFRLLPLFAVIGALAVMIGVVLKELPG